MENKMNHHTFILGMVSGAVLAILIIFASSANAAPGSGKPEMSQCTLSLKDGKTTTITTTTDSCLKLQAGLTNTPFSPKFEERYAY